MGAKQSKHNAAFDQLFANMIQSIQESMTSVNLQEVLDAALSAQEGDVTAFEEMKAEQAAKTAEMNRGVLEDLWTSFDANGDGVLSQEENRALVREYLEASKEHFPRVVEESLRIGMEVGLQAMAASLDPDDVERMRKDVKKGIKKAKKDINKHVISALDAMLADADAAADDVLQHMDLDNDGTVDKEEFIAAFLTSVQAVVSPDKFLADFQGGASLM